MTIKFKLEDLSSEAHKVMDNIILNEIILPKISKEKKTLEEVDTLIYTAKFKLILDFK